MEKPEHLEPDLWNFDKDGLYCGWYDQKPQPENCIDKALKKIYGDRWDKPWWFHKKDRLTDKK